MSDIHTGLTESVTTTLGYLIRKSKEGKTQILLGEHYKQKKLNGFGGKVGDKEEFKNETIEQGLKREAQEEFKITPMNIEKRAVVLFDFIEKNKHILNTCHVYFINEWQGEISETIPMHNPTWFDINNMPWEKMWPNDRVWLEQLLTHKGFLDVEYKFETDEGTAKEVRKEWK